MSADDAALQFRRARRDDLPALVAMLADDPLGATREDPSMPPAPAYARAFDAIDADPNQELVVATRGDAIVGVLQLTVIPYLTHRGTSRALIEGVRVASAHRDRGVGRAMLAHAIERARTRGCGLVQLTSDKRRPDALRFYASLGFVASHEGLKLDLRATARPAGA